MSKQKKLNLRVMSEKIRDLKEIIITNIVLLGQTPCLPDKSYHRVNYQRVEVFLERVGKSDVDECSIDKFGNPIGIIKGKNPSKPPIFLLAHMDTSFGNEQEYHYSVTENAIIGAGLMDNSLGVGVMMSIPEILTRLNMKFESDIYLVGLVESLRESNLKSIRSILGSWNDPIRGAICIEAGELGRMNYFSNSMTRLEIAVSMPTYWVSSNLINVNAIVVLNEVIRRILEIRLPQRPRSDIILGQINSGFKHGESPKFGKLGLEILSESEEMKNEIYENIESISNSVAHRNGSSISIKKISDVKAANLTFNHPLVSKAVNIIEELNIKPIFGSSESELSVFLSRKIPALTVGITHGRNYHHEDAEAEIEPIFKGIAQVVGILSAIDQGVCDE